MSESQIWLCRSLIQIKNSLVLSAYTYSISNCSVTNAISSSLKSLLNANSTQILIHLNIIKMQQHNIFITDMKAIINYCKIIILILILILLIYLFQYKVNLQNVTSISLKTGSFRNIFRRMFSKIGIFIMQSACLVMISMCYINLSKLFLLKQQLQFCIRFSFQNSFYPISGDFVLFLFSHCQLRGVGRQRCAGLRRNTCAQWLLEQQQVRLCTPLIYTMNSESKKIFTITQFFVLFKN